MPTAHAQTPHGVFESRNAVCGKKAISTTPLTIKKWMLIPNPAIEELTSSIKYAGSQVGLVQYITIQRNATPEQVHNVIHSAFPQVNFDLHGYE